MMEYAESYIELNPNDSEGWYALGFALHDMNRKKARVAYTTGIEVNPDDPRCRFGLGSLMLFDSDFTSAEEQLVIATQIDPNIYLYWDALSIYYEKLNQWEKVESIQDEIRNMELSVYDIPRRIQYHQIESKTKAEVRQDIINTKAMLDGDSDFHDETQSMYNIEDRQVTRTPREAILVNSFMRWLKKKGIKSSKEVQYIDVTFSLKKESYAVEAKFFHKSAITQIRNAVGQLLHYNHYPDRSMYTYWIVLLNREPTNEDRKWITFLREEYDLPLFVGWESRKGFVFDSLKL